MKPFDIVLYIATVVMWGLSWISMHYQVATVPPEVSIVWRYLLATPMMFLVALYRGDRLRYRLADHGYFVLLALTVFSVNYILQYYAAKYVSSGLLSIQFTLAAVGNVVLAAIFFGTAIERRVIVGGLLGAGGVAAMFYPEVEGLHLDGDVLFGSFLSLLAMLCFCFGNVVSLGIQRRRIPVFASLSWAMLYGTILVAVVAALKGQSFAIDTNPVYLWSMAFSVIFASVLGFGAYFTLLNRIGAARAGYSTVLYPVVALAASTWLEGYRWTPLAVAGLICVMAGVFLVLRQRKA